MADSSDTMMPGNKVEVPHRRDWRKKSPSVSTSIGGDQIACDFCWRSNSPRSANEIPWCVAGLIKRYFHLLLLQIHEDIASSQMKSLITKQFLALNDITANKSLLGCNQQTGGLNKKVQVFSTPPSPISVEDQQRHTKAHGKKHRNVVTLHPKGSKLHGCCDNPEVKLEYVIAAKIYVTLFFFFLSFCICYYEKRS